MAGQIAMITEDQSEVVRFLESPLTHGGAPVERVDTHASIIFLAGARALKLKRAVRYDYLDFSTVDRRRAMCEAEVRINHRTAPSLYRGAVAVTRRPDLSLALGGPGAPVDWLVEMTRFDQEGLLDRLADGAALDLALMPQLAATIARFHQSAERRTDHGGATSMAWVVDGNATALSELGADILDPVACTALTRSSHEHIERHAPLLDERRARGSVRQCHGDLHLRNIVCLENRPTLFDAIEFNDDLACIDVFYDLAFLLMDLWHRRLVGHANTVWNQYLFETCDFGGIPLLPLFLSCRAAVRAKTSVSAASLQVVRQRRHEYEELARDYIAIANQLLHPPPGCLIAIGGCSGSGKSTLARALAPLIGAVPGAVVIRSDETRKQLLGVDPLERLSAEDYAADVNRLVYARLTDHASQVVAAGHAAIVDAVHARPDDRDAIEQVANAWHVPFFGFWLDAPEPVLTARSERRGEDASDADASVIRAQLAQNSGAVTWHRIDASLPPGHVLRAAVDTLTRRLNNGIVRFA